MQMGRRPVLALVDFGAEEPVEDDETLTYEMIRDTAGEVIAIVIADGQGRVTLLTMYPAIGGTVVVSIRYDEWGEAVAKLCSTYDEQGNLVDVVDLLATESTEVQRAQTLVSSEPSVASVAETSLDGGMMTMSTPTAPPAATEAFVYDHLGNRVTYTDKEGYPTTYAHNGLNQYTHVHRDLVWDLEEDYYPEHDANGNLSRDRHGYVYSYDYRNRLTQIAGELAFGYDALGRRIKKTDDDAGATTYFYYDPFGRVIAEYDKPDGGSAALARVFVYGNGIDEVLAMFTPYHAGDPADWDEFLDFCGVWLLDSGDPGYDDAFDVVDDNVIGLKDFAVFAASWDLPSSEESDWYYLHDALGSVRMVVGYDGQTVSVANGYTYRPFEAVCEANVTRNCRAARGSGGPARIVGVDAECGQMLADPATDPDRSGHGTQPSVEVQVIGEEGHLGQPSGILQRDKPHVTAIGGPGPAGGGDPPGDGDRPVAIPLQLPGGHIRGVQQATRVYREGDARGPQLGGEPPGGLIISPLSTRGFRHRVEQQPLARRRRLARQLGHHRRATRPQTVTGPHADQRRQFLAPASRASAQVGQVVEWPLGQDLLDTAAGQALDQRQRGADRRPFKDPLSTTVVHVAGPDTHTMPHGVPDVYPHRIHAVVIVEQGAIERLRPVGLEIGALPGDMSIDRRVCLAVGIRGEPQDIVPDLLGRLAVDPLVIGLVVHKLLVLLLQTGGGHALGDLAAEAVGLGDSVAGDFDGQLHHVLLIKHYAIGVGEDLLQLRMQVGEGLVMDVAVDVGGLHATGRRSRADQ